MIEIRPIAAHEAREFLRLLCEVFSLDMERASGVFFTEPLYDLRRKWALFEGGQMRSILTTTALPFGWGDGIGIAGVATVAEYQGRGLASALLKYVLAEAAAAGEGTALLFAHKPGLYEGVGFRAVDRVVRGTIIADPDYSPGRVLGNEEIRERYHRWASESDVRLKRNNQRWAYWEWGYRVCEVAEPGGYVCFEGTTVREAVLPAGLASWPVPESTEWCGLEKVTNALRVPLATVRKDLTLMAYNAPDESHLFMTDQF